MLPKYFRKPSQVSTGYRGKNLCFRPLPRIVIVIIIVYRRRRVHAAVTCLPRRRLPAEVNWRLLRVGGMELCLVPSSHPPPSRYQSMLSSEGFHGQSGRCGGRKGKHRLPCVGASKGESKEVANRGGFVRCGWRPEKQRTKRGRRVGAWNDNFRGAWSEFWKKKYWDASRGIEE